MRILLSLMFFVISGLSCSQDLNQQPKSNVMIGDYQTLSCPWADLLNTNDLVIKAVGLDKTKDILKRMDEIVALHPKRAFIMAGTNDIYFDKTNFPEFIDNYTKIFEILQNANIKVFVTSIPKCDAKKLKPPRGQNFNDAVKGFNDWTRMYCSANGITYIELGSKLEDKDGLKSIYTDDVFHLNLAADKIWAAMVKYYIDNTYV